MIVACLLFSVLVSTATTGGIVLSLLSETVGFFREISLVRFLTDTRWTPLFLDKHFGILPLLFGTLLITAIAALIALPIGLFSAVYLNCYAKTGVRKALKPFLEVLAGVPTVVYGYFALTLVTPLIRQFFPSTSMFNALSAGVVVGIMIIPTVSSLSEDALTAVPKSLRDAGYALGATRFEVAVKILLPAGASGVIASFILAVSRAVGETMIVALAAGSTPKLTLNPLESIQTITGYIVQVSLGDTPYGSIEYKTIFAVGMVLFLITLLMNFLGQAITRRFREEYE
ncbi:MAG: phosphate ABC transporter permease subunit PstC [Candidatus Aquicultorales bacterium]